jgi:hypothetical protein
LEGRLFTVAADPPAFRAFVTVRDPVREFVSILTGPWLDDFAPCRTDAEVALRSLARRALVIRALAGEDPVRAVFAVALVLTFIAARSRAGATTPMCPPWATVVRAVGCVRACSMLTVCR